MTYEPYQKSPICDLHACVENFARSFSPALPIIMDPRISRHITCDENALREALRQLADEIKKTSSLSPLVIYELDDPERSLFRFEISGTSLGFTFPPQSSLPPSIEGSLGELTILVAEDNVINQQIARECLLSLGFTCDIVNDGAAAVEAILARSYDLIFMDIHMPVMDGLLATRTIRTLPNGRHPYITALTAYAMPGDRARALDSGMDDYITKPCRIDTFSKVLRKAASRKI